MTVFLLPSTENTKMSSGGKHDSQTNDPIFFIYSLSFICWYILILHFKTFKIQFHGVLPPLHYVLVCKMYIYMLKMTFSSLLTYTSFFYKTFANFWYMTCFVPNFILIWPQSDGLSTLKYLVFSQSTFTPPTI